MKEISDGIWKEGKNIFTMNLVLGQQVYGEEIKKIGSNEYRQWDPTRSKLSAAIINGFKDVPLCKGSKILYLGASTGTTISHISDIVKEDGIIYAVEFAEKPFRSLILLAEKRKNIVPILADARKPETYGWVEEIDLIYADIAQPEMTDILIRNSEMFLKRNGMIMLAVKSRSIDVTKHPPQVWKEQAQRLKASGFDILELISLEPYEKDHAMIVARKKE